MKPSTLHQFRLDVERLRKAADRLAELQDAYDDLRVDLSFARDALKVIAELSDGGCSDYLKTKKIHARSVDTLRMIERKP